MKLLVLLRRWHRWLGVLVTLPVVLLAVTGIALNHADRLGLARTPVPTWLAGVYGVELPTSFQGVPSGDGWLAAAGGQLYHVARDGDVRLVGDCPAPLKGAVAQGELTVVACAQQLLVLDALGRVQEQLGAAWGVPAFEAFGRQGEALVLVAEGGPRRFSLETLESTPLEAGASWERAWRVTLPEAAARQLRPRAIPPALHWQRLLQDLHSGRILGATGERIMDAAGVVLVLLAASGLVMWWRVARRSPSARR